MKYTFTQQDIDSHTTELSFDAESMDTVAMNIRGFLWACGYDRETIEEALPDDEYCRKCSDEVCKLMAIGEETTGGN